VFTDPFPGNVYTHHNVSVVIIQNIGHPDLKLLGFCLWSHTEDLVYQRGVILRRILDVAPGKKGNSL
jgi:hypothetical protein